MSEFAKVNEDGNLELSKGYLEVVVHGRVFKKHIVSEAEYNSAGYYIVNRAYIPETEDEFQAIPTGKWEVVNDECRKMYEIVPVVHTIEEYNEALEKHLYAERLERGYDSREPSDYKDSKVERWKQDAEDWIDHRDDVMLYGLGVINTYKETGEAPTLSEFKAALPKIVWTYTED